VLLERTGWIEIKRGGGRKRSNHYVLKYPDKALTGFNPENPVSRGKKTLSAVAQNPATTVADKKRLTAKRTRRNAFSVSPGERECSRALAVVPRAPVAYAGAREKFDALVAIWKRPHGDEDVEAGWRGFVAQCRQGDPDEIAAAILASGHRWVAAYQHKPEMLKPLWRWLSEGTWKNQPPSPKPKRNAGKASLANIALAVSREEDQS
jgi:hypothetical protein